eukprot:13330527-Alexandrium_andersonii.AAC.1
MDEFRVRRSPQRVFVGRTERWARNLLVTGGPSACPVCGEQHSPARIHRDGANTTPFNKVMVVHSDRDG